VAAADDIARHAFFVFDGGLVCTIYTDATGGPDNDAVATESLLWLAFIIIYRIDATNSADVKFYIDGAQGCIDYYIPCLNTVAAMMVAPIFMMTKAGGAGLGSFAVDYCRVWQATR